MALLTQAFFLRDTVTVAKELIGVELIYHSPQGRVGGIINETEAYTQEDPACHAYNGIRTHRNQVMFKSGGHIYIYMIYGLYYCLNVVTEAEGRGCAVLIRSVIPTTGIEIMNSNRHGAKRLSDGPGKLMMALGMTLDLNDTSLSKTSHLQLIKKLALDPIEAPRIGIRKNTDALWRFYINTLPES